MALTGFGPLVGTDVKAAMRNVNASAYVRMPFTLPNGFNYGDEFNGLLLKMKYDDGFVAYLNGVEVARRNAPGASGTPPAWNAAATADRNKSQAIRFEEIDVSTRANLLRAGTNVLAIHGLNDAAN